MTLTTPRLLLRRADTGDAAFLVELLNSPGWLQFIGDRHVYTPAEAITYLEDRMLPAYAAPGHGSYVVTARDSGTALGLVGVYRRPELNTPDFGFAFLDHGQGRGYAEEASRALLSSEAVRALPELLAITRLDNVRSQRLLNKLGFVHAGTTAVSGHPNLRYRYFRPGTAVASAEI